MNTWRNKPIELDKASVARSSAPEAWNSFDNPNPTSPAT